MFHVSVRFYFTCFVRNFFVSILVLFYASCTFSWANFVTDLCDEKYGHCPTFRFLHYWNCHSVGPTHENSVILSYMWSHLFCDITTILRISGHTHASFPYIEMPLDYILPEVSLGKNILPKRKYTKKCPRKRKHIVPEKGDYTLLLRCWRTRRGPRSRATPTWGDLHCLLFPLSWPQILR